MLIKYMYHIYSLVNKKVMLRGAMALSKLTVISDGPTNGRTEVVCRGKIFGNHQAKITYVEIDFGINLSVDLSIYLYISESILFFYA